MIATHQRFEHQSITGVLAFLDENIARLARDGFELVAVIYTGETAHGIKTAVAYLKRPVEIASAILKAEHIADCNAAMAIMQRYLDEAETKNVPLTGTYIISASDYAQLVAFATEHKGYEAGRVLRLANRDWFAA